MISVPMHYIPICINCPCSARIPLNTTFFSCNAPIPAWIVGNISNAAQFPDNFFFYFLIKCPSSCPQAQNARTRTRTPPPSSFSVTQSGQLHSTALRASEKVFPKRPRTIFRTSAFENTRALMQIKNRKEKRFRGKMAQT